ncbi:TPA: hypothetical protein VDV84_006254 [Pseudomonas aeruginosa]|uniref:hypothetical protein n=1 Tax=Pseudomonas TaxID=286 RepID=UPI0003D1F42C|nr:MULTISPECIES: hypothetical protein [Pseudomonas]MDU7022962.1 hypothetical protein [Staphylococcus epidermidis]AHB55810.1 hypothetical protein U769_12927 [Pseudomonas aeruginosa MTB-1]EIU2649588.1 hypothetical protein [Pseudomonas aeruginosa]EIU2689586.1 hypothetical protein [Pseudomonas aeruginosa]EIU3128359.1 hypothetical protein [Pseudomonas aeruginosa]
MSGLAWAVAEDYSSKNKSVPFFLYDRAGNIVEFKDKISRKLFMIRKFTDQGILDLGQQAAAGGYKGALSKGLSQYDSVAGGVTFRVYLDKFTGAVTSFHPK